ncbi:uncharacterized protein LOC128994959 [Macrosteles quadrilineatus]|uniref:uncharacterized protein LOC128994959 n=1 Tax=Macrosteles quadrilineatus TaxID=74068 RepID=UPI0023E093C2|nr:uncharacterized protein LOC128994959 [Macrosteles quadrilineatus]
MTFEDSQLSTSTLAPPPLKPAVTCSLPPPPPPVKPVSYGYSAVPDQLITYEMPLTPVTYKPPASAVCYEYSYPAVKPVVPKFLKTPIVPLKPVRYITAPHFQHSTPTPLKTLKYSKTVPAVSYEYLPPPSVYLTPSTPTVSYKYSIPAPTAVSNGYKSTTSILKPLVDFPPVQFLTPAPVHFEYSTPVPDKTYYYSTTPVSY